MDDDTTAQEEELAKRRASATARALELLGPILGYLERNPSYQQHRDLHMCEFFCGVMSICGCMASWGYAAAGCDVVVNDQMDFMSPMGFLLAVQLTRRICPGGFMWLGPPCSTWVFFSRGSTHRSMSTPLGDGSSPAAESANALVSRMTTLLYFAASRGVNFILEQPAGSLMSHHPAFAELIQVLNVQSVYLHLGSFKSDSVKPLRLFGTVPWLSSLARTMPSSHARLLKGVSQVTRTCLCFSYRIGSDRG